MATERLCPRCGTLLSSEALEGLCPKCVRRIAFERVPEFLQAHPVRQHRFVAPREIDAISRAEALSLDAAEMAEPQERTAFLDRECGGDVALRVRIEALLTTNNEAGDYFESAAFSPRMEADFVRPVPEEAGECIGNYRLLEQIGQGGFGTVWVAEQERPVRRLVALKIIKPGMDTREVVARFEQERQALAMMDHPNIAKVFDAGATQWGRPFFVMELVRGIKITDYCDQANLPTAERLAIFIQVCQAVQHAHQKGIIHRDLKPSNILVTLHDGVPVPKVIDFGIAKAIQQERLTELTLHTEFAQMIGTPLYMSPEQAEMNGGDIDTRSDIYSLGVLLYELLTGRTPFDPGELMRKAHDEIRRVIREQEPLTPSAFVHTMAADLRTNVAQRRQTDSANLTSQIRGDLDWIVMKALEKDRTRRYETANGLALDIIRHLDSEPVLARPPSQVYRFQKFIRRNKPAFAAGTTVVTALVAGFAFSTWSFLNEQEHRRGAERERRTADLERASAERERRTAEEQRGLAKENEAAARQLRYVSDINLAYQALMANQFGRGRRLLDAHRPGNAEEADLRGWEWRWLWQELRGEARASLARRPVAPASVSISPDGRRVAVGWADGRVEVCAANGDTPPRCLQESGPPAHVAFSPAGAMIVFGSSDGVVKRYDLDSGSERILCRLPAAAHDFSFSRDGEIMAVLTLTGNGSPPRWDPVARAQVSDEPKEETALILNVADGRILLQVQLPRGSSSSFNNVRVSPDHQRLYVTHGAFHEPGLRCVQIENGKTLWERAAPDGPAGRKLTGFSAMDLSPDGQILVTAAGYEQHAIQRWNAVSGEPLDGPLDAHSLYVRHLAFSPDGGVLASGSADETVRLWDTRSWKEHAAPLRGNGDEVETLSFSPDSRRLVTGSRDGQVLTWDLASRQQSGGRHPFPENTRFAFILPGGRHAFAQRLGSGSLIRSLFDVRTGSVTPYNMEMPMTGIYAGPNYFGYVGTPRDFQLYEFRDDGAALLADLPLGPDVGPMLAYSPEARLLAWAKNRSPTIHVTSLDDPHKQTDLTADGEVCMPASFDAAGKFLLGVAPDGSARVWEIASGKRLPAAEDYISPYGMTVFGDSRNALGSQAIRHWVTSATRPPATPRPVRRTDPAPPGFWPPGNITCRAYSPDGRTTALATDHGSVLIFDAGRQQKKATLHGRAHSISSLAFSPDGLRLLCGNDALWDVETWEELLPLPGEGALHQVAQISDDGNTLLIGSWHRPGETQCWHAPTLQEIADAEKNGSGWPRSAK